MTRILMALAVAGILNAQEVTSQRLIDADKET